jgi:hypothetical protein
VEENTNMLQEVHLPGDDLSRLRQMIKAIDSFALVSNDWTIGSCKRYCPTPKNRSDMNQKASSKLEESTRRIDELLQERAGFEQNIIELQGRLKEQRKTHQGMLNSWSHPGNR